MMSPRLNAHASAWGAVMQRGLGHQLFPLVAEKPTGNIVAGLPLSMVDSRLFGRFLVSQPYLNTGGVWSNTLEDAVELVDRAVCIANDLDVQYLELRHEVRLEHPKLTQERTDKVHMRLVLPGSAEELLQSFKSKLRSQVKKSGESGGQVVWGGKELLSDFYHVFSINMRDLGTPVYSNRLFHTILEEFVGNAELCLLKIDGKPAAGALLVHYPELLVTEVPSASTMRRYNPLGVNMWMYWNLLQRAIERGSKTFDFGRSSVGSGTHKFKAQWGATPHPACWQYYVRHGNPADMRPDSPKKQLLIRTWQKLPVWFTRVIGPPIIRGIP